MSAFLSGLAIGASNKAVQLMDEATENERAIAAARAKAKYENDMLEKQYSLKLRNQREMASYENNLKSTKFDGLQSMWENPEISNQQKLFALVKAGVDGSAFEALAMSLEGTSGEGFVPSIKDIASPSSVPVNEDTIDGQIDAKLLEKKELLQKAGSTLSKRRSKQYQLLAEGIDVELDNLHEKRRLYRDATEMPRDVKSQKWREMQINSRVISTGKMLKSIINSDNVGGIGNLNRAWTQITDFGETAANNLMDIKDMSRNKLQAIASSTNDSVTPEAREWAKEKVAELDDLKSLTAYKVLMYSWVTTQAEARSLSGRMSVEVLKQAETTFGDKFLNTPNQLISLIDNEIERAVMSSKEIYKDVEGISYPNAVANELVDNLMNRKGFWESAPIKKRLDSGDSREAIREGLLKRFLKPNVRIK